MTNYIGWTPPPGAVVAPPVHPKTWVSVLYSDGQFSMTDYEADTFNWSSVGDGPRVVAYAVVEEYVVPTTMTPETAQALLDGATPGPWQVNEEFEGTGWGHSYSVHMRENIVADVAEGVSTGEDAALIAAAPDLARAYIAQAAELARLRAQIEAADKLVEALAFYSDLSGEGPWHLPGEDYGKRARSALSAYEEARK